MASTRTNPATPFLHNMSLPLSSITTARIDLTRRANTPVRLEAVVHKLFSSVESEFKKTVSKIGLSDTYADRITFDVIAFPRIISKIENVCAVSLEIKLSVDAEGYHLSIRVVYAYDTSDSLILETTMKLK